MKTHPLSVHALSPAVLLVISLTPMAAEGQTIAGRVLEEGSERPVPTALIRLVDVQGELHADVLSDSLGRFTITPREEGEYYLEARRIGYGETRSPLLALTVGGEVPLDLFVEPLPVGLEGFEITVQRGVVRAQAERELRHFGLRPEALGRRLITRDVIAEPPFKRNFSSILTWNPVPGLHVAGSPQGPCYYFRRGVSFGGPGCAIVVLNGMEITGEVLSIIDPEGIEMVAVLTPFEAQTLYGVRGEAGAIMIWTGIPQVE
jgi:hypothetical protein